jgi:hypothetical protein
MGLYPLVQPPRLSPGPRRLRAVVAAAGIQAISAFPKISAITTGPLALAAIWIHLRVTGGEEERCAGVRMIDPEGDYHESR